MCLYLTRMMVRKVAETADRIVNPTVESRETRIDAGQIGTTTTDTKTDDAHLEPLAVLFTDQRTASITL